MGKRSRPAPVENAENEGNRRGEQKANTLFRLVFASSHDRLKANLGVAAHHQFGAPASARRFHDFLLGVVVEATARLAAEVAGGNVLFQQRAGAVLGVAQAFVEDVHDVDAHVEANKVG